MMLGSLRLNRNRLWKPSLEVKMSSGLFQRDMDDRKYGIGIYNHKERIATNGVEQKYSTKFVGAFCKAARSRR